MTKDTMEFEDLKICDVLMLNHKGHKEITKNTMEFEDLKICDVLMNALPEAGNVERRKLSILNVQGGRQRIKRVKRIKRFNESHLRRESYTSNHKP